MNRILLLALSALIICTINVTDLFALPILQNGDISEEPKDLNNWFGLYLLNNEKSVLVPVELVIKRYHHTVADDPKDINNKSKWSGRTLLVNPETPEKYGLKIVSETEESGLIIVLQSKALVPGAIATTFPGNGSFEYRSVGQFGPLGEIGLSLNNETYRLSSQESDNCRITLIRGDISFEGPSATFARQCIFSLPSNYDWPRLVWAGDIDRDKKLDLVFDTDSESSYERELFLSKNVEKDEIVKKSGSFWRPSGC